MTKHQHGEFWGKSVQCNANKSLGNNLCYESYGLDSQKQGHGYAYAIHTSSYVLFNCGHVPRLIGNRNLSRGVQGVMLDTERILTRYKFRALIRLLVRFCICKLIMAICEI
jgi:hypothetical protein